MSNVDVKLTIEVVADDVLRSHGRLLIATRELRSDSAADVSVPYLASEILHLNASTSLATTGGPSYSQVQRSWLLHANASEQVHSSAPSVKRHLLVAQVQFTPPPGIDRIVWEISDARTCHVGEPKAGECALLWLREAQRGSYQSLQLALSLLWVSVKATAADTGQSGHAPGLQAELYTEGNGSTPLLLSSAGFIPV
jgi:hypothetical protein